MRRREVAICMLFIIGTIVGCGDTRRSQAIEMCKEMLRQSEAPGNWEDVDRSGVDLRGGDYWWNYPGVSVIHQISPEATWKIDFWRWPVSQADRMNGVEWKASLEIIHALQLTYRDAEEAEWVDVRAFCRAESNERIHVTFWVTELERLRQMQEKSLP